MWTYSVTTATSAASSSLIRSYSESQQITDSNSETAINGTATATGITNWIHASTYAAGPLETRVSYAEYLTEVRTFAVTGYNGTSAVTSSQTEKVEISISDYQETIFSRSARSYTSARTNEFSYNDDGVTTISQTTLSTSSIENTFAATRPTYLSGTETTTSSVPATVTTSTSTTASSLTGTTGGTITTTAGTASSMTTSTQSSTITTTVYLTGAARTLTVAEALVGVTEALAGEMLWEVTATDNSAGFISDIASTFTRRTGTLAVASTVLPVAAVIGSTARTFSTLTTTAAATVNTTALSAATESYVPFAGAFPATATATRSFTLLTVVTTTIAQDAIVSATRDLASSQTAAATRTVRRTTTAGLPIAWNQAPTVTATELLGVTVATSTTLSDYPRGFPDATSASATVSAATLASTATTATTNTTTSVSTTTNTTTQTGTAGTTYTVFISLGMSVDTCAVPPSTVYAYSLTTHIGYTDAATYSTVHDAPNNHTLYTSHEQWFAGTITLTANTNVSSTRSTATTATLTLSADYSYYRGSSSTAIEGVSLTTAVLFPQVTFAASAQSSVVAWRQGGGYQHPLDLGTGDALATNQAGAGALRWSDTASQMNRSGAVTPALLTDQRRYTTGATVGSAAYVVSESKFYVTTGVSYTTTSTAGTATFTITQTSATGTATASLHTGTGATYYSAETHSSGSRIGGQAGNTAFAFTAILSPGVVHSTTQSAGASGSATSWATDWNVVVGTSRGLALPMTQESAWSVTQQATAWSLFNKSELVTERGATLRPLVVLSMYPSH